MRGRIVALSCGFYSVNGDDGILYRVKARGLFRNHGQKPTVGDIVELDDATLVIHEIYPRTTYLKRPPVSNISQLLIIQSLTEPEFSYHLIFKYLTYANLNGLDAKIILTKSDKFSNQALLDEIKDTFSRLNIPLYFVSNKTKDGVEEVRKLFANQVTCLIGQSGVGKSSLINAISLDFNREVGEFSMALGRGKHQTKEVILLPYEGGYIVDTPGFSSLDLNLYKEDLAINFPGFNKLYTECYFTDCLHISESKCKVKEAIAHGEIPQIAYDNYLKLSSEAIFRNQRYNK